MLEHGEIKWHVFQESRWLTGQSFARFIYLFIFFADLTLNIINFWLDTNIGMNYFWPTWHSTFFLSSSRPSIKHFLQVKIWLIFFLDEIEQSVAVINFSLQPPFPMDGAYVESLNNTCTQDVVRCFASPVDVENFKKLPETFSFFLETGVSSVSKTRISWCCSLLVLAPHPLKPRRQPRVYADQNSASTRRNTQFAGRRFVGRRSTVQVPRWFVFWTYHLEL